MTQGRNDIRDVSNNDGESLLGRSEQNGKGFLETYLLSSGGGGVRGERTVSYTTPISAPLQKEWADPPLVLTINSNLMSKNMSECKEKDGVCQRKGCHLLPQK